MKLCLVPVPAMILNQAWLKVESYDPFNPPKYVPGYRPCCRRIKDNDEACYEHGGRLGA